MKKTKILALMLMAVPVLTFTGCSDDDDEGGGGSPQDDTSVIVTDEGDKVLLTSNGLYSYTYDGKGRCIYISDGYEGYNMSYDPFELYYEDGYNIVPSFTKEGYLSKLDISYDISDDYSQEKGSGTISFSYNNGRLSKITVKGSGKDVYDGETYPYNRSGSTSFTWKNGNLTRLRSEYSGSDYAGDNQGEKYSELYDADISYGSTRNKYNQYVRHMINWLSDALDDDLMSGFAYIGMFGKGSDYLPSEVEQQVVYEDDDDGKDESNYTYTLSYVLNNNGTVSSETYRSSSGGRGTYNYRYNSFVSPSPSDAPKKVGVAGKEKAKSLSNIFKRHRR